MDSDISTDVILNDDGFLELRQWSCPERNTYQYWKMPMEEVEELACWWFATGKSFNNSQAPIKNFNTGRLRISMFTSSLIHVKSIDSFGKPRMIGYTLPRSLVDSIATWVFIRCRG